jgi:5-methylcytosine-specific restriction endonuclease McrBC GTP-binding regulatory subunit McrB
MTEQTIAASPEQPPKLPMQRILFGSPGTGKSHKVHKTYLKDFDTDKVFKTVFHPEYKYGDFMGRLIPLTDETGQVRYEYQAGHFLKALAKAYQCWLEKGDEEAKPVALVIDEINRGNSSAIFGTVFQLLDRDDDGWSSYQLDLSAVERDRLLKEMGYKPDKNDEYNGKPTRYIRYIKDNDNTQTENFVGVDDKCLVANGKIKLPPNLSIFATMNTSDESIYYMDSAFKRRWDWEFVPVEGELTIPDGNAFNTEAEWKEFVIKLNGFIKSNSKHIRKIEDKLIGHYFLKAPYTYDKIQSKLMFFLWDSVFSHDKAPLNDKLELKKDEDKLVTFGDFANKVKEFVEKNQSAVMI